jgi:hypothetical protein
LKKTVSAQPTAIVAHRLQFQIDHHQRLSEIDFWSILKIRLIRTIELIRQIAGTVPRIEAFKA